MDGEGADAVCPAAGIGGNREQGVGRLGLSIGEPLVVLPLVEAEVVRVETAYLMSPRWKARRSPHCLPSAASATTG